MLSTQDKCDEDKGGSDEVIYDRTPLIVNELLSVVIIRIIDYFNKTVHKKEQEIKINFSLGNLLS